MTNHSIFGATAVPGAAQADDNNPVFVGSRFYTTTASGVSIVGARIFIPTGSVLIGQTLALKIWSEFVDPNNLNTAGDGVATTGTLVAGWNDAMLGSPIPVDGYDAALRPNAIPTVAYAAPLLSGQYRFVLSLGTNFDDDATQAWEGGPYYWPATPAGVPALAGGRNRGAYTYPGSADAETSSSYGIDIIFDDGSGGLSKIALTATVVSGTEVELDWDDTDPTITDGVTLVRCAGTQVNDGNGNPPSDPDYDPLTIGGATVIAEGVMSAPYNDTGLTPGTYTYWVARTAG